jgi:replicative DNA helicase
MVHDREIAGKLLQIIGAEDFANEALGTVCKAIRKLFNADAPIDRMTVLQETGDAYEELITAAIDIRVVPSNAEYYAGMLRERSRLDRIRDAAAAVMTAESVDDARKSADSINAELVTRRQWQAIGMEDALNAFFDRHTQEKAPKFLDFGFPKLRQRLFCEPGDFIVIAGEPSSGKTALAAQIAVTIARSHRVGFFTLETSSEKLTDRMVAQQSGIPLKTIKTNTLAPDQWKKAADTATRISTLPLDQIQASGMTVQDIQSYSIAHHYEVIFVDYLQIIRPQNARLQRFEQVTQISMGLHTLAQQAGITVIALAQLSRPDKSKKKKDPPSMHDLRESGQIEQDADAVLLLYHKDPNDNAGPRMLKIGKNKEGERADFELNFKGETQTFTEGSSWSNTMSEIRKAAKDTTREFSQVKMEDLGTVKNGEELPF